MKKFFEKYQDWWRKYPIQWWLIIVIAVAISVDFGIISLSEGIQILLMLTLVLVTWSYAVETRRIVRISEEAARSAAEQAEASKKMAEEMRQQRLSVSQPVVWPTIWDWDLNHHRLDVHFVNVGNGPALDVDIFLGRGEKPIIRDCEHSWRSYIVAGHRLERTFLQQPDSTSYNKLVGEYTLLVEWRNLYLSGPFFQARLPFSLEVDDLGRLVPKEGVVNIERISAKRKPMP